jgi:hypothetical protein
LKKREPVSELAVDRNSNPDILTVEEAALYLRKSPSWVYKSWRGLGGRKLGFSLVSIANSPFIGILKFYNFTHPVKELNRP